MAKSNAAFMSGVPELLVLQLLSQQEMYGYELVKKIHLVSKEAISLAEGVIYPVLHSLDRQGVIKARARSVGGRKRVYYSITAKGRRRLDEVKHEWHRVSGGVQSILAGENG